MTLPVAPIRRALPLRGLAILAVGVALLVVSLRQVGWGSVAESLRAVGGGWLVAVVALGAVRMALRAWAWVVCSRTGQAAGIPLGPALSAVLAADAVGNLTPLGLLASEPTKVMLARRHVSTSASVSSVAVENGFYIVSVVLVLLGGLWVLLIRAGAAPGLTRAGAAVLLAAIGATAAGFQLFRTRPALLSRVGGALARLAGRPAAADGLRDVEARIYDVIGWPAARLLQVLTLESLFHVVAVVEVWLVLRLLPGGGTVSAADAFVMETAGRFITVAFKFIPYRLGVDELGSGSVSRLLGLGVSAGVALALVRRVRVLILNAIGIVLLARSTPRAS